MHEVPLTMNFLSSSSTMHVQNKWLASTQCKLKAFTFLTGSEQFITSDHKVITLHNTP